MPSSLKTGRFSTERRGIPRNRKLIFCYEAGFMLPSPTCARLAELPTSISRPRQSILVVFMMWHPSPIEVWTLHKKIIMKTHSYREREFWRKNFWIFNKNLRAFRTSKNSHFLTISISFELLLCYINTFSCKDCAMHSSRTLQCLFDW